MRYEIIDLVRDDLLRVAGAETRLHHRRRIDVDLEAGPAPRENVALEGRRNVDDERVGALVHQRDDVSLGDRPHRLEQGRQERMCDPARQFGMVLVDDGDRGVVQFLRIAPRLHDYGQRERVDDQVVQTKMVESFENAGFAHVGKAMDGFTPEVQLLLEIRSFYISLVAPPSARIEISAKWLGADAKISAECSFSATAPATGVESPAAAAALNNAFQTVARDIVVWARATM